MPGSRTCKVLGIPQETAHARTVGIPSKLRRVPCKQKPETGEGKENRVKASPGFSSCPYIVHSSRQYEVELAKLRESRKFTEDQLARIRIQTLDSCPRAMRTTLSSPISPRRMNLWLYYGDLHRICLMLDPACHWTHYLDGEGNVALLRQKQEHRYTRVFASSSLSPYWHQAMSSILVRVLRPGVRRSTRT